MLLVDTDRVSTPISNRIYGQFLGHINHSVEDGIFAEQIREQASKGRTSKPIGNRLLTTVRWSLLRSRSTMANAVCGSMSLAAMRVFDKGECFWKRAYGMTVGCG